MANQFNSNIRAFGAIIGIMVIFSGWIFSALNAQDDKIVELEKNNIYTNEEIKSINEKLDNILKNYKLIPVSQTEIRKILSQEGRIGEIGLYIEK